jgi:hypothetical protein
MKIHSRETALKEEFIFDISKLATEAGIIYPTAITDTLMELVNNKPKHEDKEGRIWDILTMLKYAIKKAKPNTSTLKFSLILNEILTHKKNPQGIELKAIVHGGDNQEPVITIMIFNEYLYSDEQSDEQEEILVCDGIY